MTKPVSKTRADALASVEARLIALIARDLRDVVGSGAHRSDLLATNREAHLARHGATSGARVLLDRTTGRVTLIREEAELRRLAEAGDLPRARNPGREASQAPHERLPVPTTVLAGHLMRDDFGAVCRDLERSTARTLARHGVVYDPDAHGTARGTAVYSARSAAIEAARELAAERGAQVFRHVRDGGDGGSDAFHDLTEGNSASSSTRRAAG